MKTKTLLAPFVYSILFTVGFMLLVHAIAIFARGIQTQTNLVPLLRDSAIVFVSVAAFRWLYFQSTKKGRLPKILVPIVLMFDSPDTEKNSSIIKLLRLGLAILKTATNIVLIASVFANVLGIWVTGLYLVVGTSLYTFTDAIIVWGERRKVTQ